MTKNSKHYLSPLQADPPELSYFLIKYAFKRSKHVLVSSLMFVTKYVSKHTNIETLLGLPEETIQT